VRTHLTFGICYWNACVISPSDEVGLGKGACIFGFSEAFRRLNVEIGIIGTYVSSVALRFPVQVPHSSRDVQSTRVDDK
jgi:hypothetical protein